MMLERRTRRQRGTGEGESNYLTAGFIIVRNPKKKSCLFLFESCLFLFGIEVLCVFEITACFPPCHQVILAVQSQQNLALLLQYLLVSWYMSLCKAQERRRVLGKKRRLKSSLIVSQRQKPHQQKKTRVHRLYNPT